MRLRGTAMLRTPAEGSVVSDDGPEKRLRPGSRLILQDARGVPFEVVVERVEEGTILSR